MSNFKNLSVLFVEPVGNHGGMEFLNHQLCEALINHGCDVTLVTSSVLPRSRSHEVKLFFKGVFGSSPKWVRAMRFSFGIIRSLLLAKRRHFNLVHFQIFHVGLLQYLYVLLARKLGLKIVITAHDVGSYRAGESPILLKAIYKQSHAVIALSDVAKKELESIGVPPEQIYGVPLGNYKMFLPAFPEKIDARRELGFEGNDLVLLFFGQCKETKRLDLLIDAISEARQIGSKRIKLLVAGPVTEADGFALRKQMNNRLSGAFIHHDYFIPNQEVPKYLSAADLAVLPYDKIMQSGVILFAMSYGIPVLTSDIEGMLEVVEHKHTGLTFKQGDVSDLRDRILEVENGNWPLLKIAKKADEQIEEQYAWPRCAIKTSEIYRQVTDE